MRLLCALVLCLVVTACGTAFRDAQISQSSIELSESSGCCKSFSEIPFVSSKGGKDLEVVLDTASPSSDFPDGKSFVAGVSLPFADKGDLSLSFKTFLSTDHLPSATVLVPRFAFLDSSFGLLLIQESQRLRRGVEFFGGPFFEAVLEVPTQARYAVLLSAEVKGSALTVYAANGTRHRIPRAPTGRVRLRVTSHERHLPEGPVGCVEEKSKFAESAG